MNFDEQFDPAGTCAGFDMEQLRLLLNNTGLSVHEPSLYQITHTIMHVFMQVAGPGPRANITRKKTCVLSCMLTRSLQPSPFLLVVGLRDSPGHFFVNIQLIIHNTYTGNSDVIIKHEAATPAAQTAQSSRMATGEEGEDEGKGGGAERMGHAQNACSQEVEKEDEEAGIIEKSKVTEEKAVSGDS